MKLYSALATVWLISASAVLQGQDLEQVRKLEASGDAAGAPAEYVEDLLQALHLVLSLFTVLGESLLQFRIRRGSPGCCPGILCHWEFEARR